MKIPDFSNTLTLGDRIAMPVSGVSLIEMGPHGPLMHCLADRSHLDQQLCSLAGT